MSERTARLASELEAQVAAFERLLKTLTPAQLEMTALNTPGERFMDADEARPVNVVAYHVASFMPLHVASARARAVGETPPPLDADAINEAEASEKADITVDEAIARLRQESAAALEFINSLDDAQLERSWSTPAGEFTVEKAVRMVLIGHLDQHRRAIEATIASAEGAMNS